MLHLSLYLPLLQPNVLCAFLTLVFLLQTKIFLLFEFIHLNTTCFKCNDLSQFPQPLTPSYHQPKFLFWPRFQNMLSVISVIFFFLTPNFIKWVIFELRESSWPKRKRTIIKLQRIFNFICFFSSTCHRNWGFFLVHMPMIRVSLLSLIRCFKTILILDCTGW